MCRIQSAHGRVLQVLIQQLTSLKIFCSFSKSCINLPGHLLLLLWRQFAASQPSPFRIPSQRFRVSKCWSWWSWWWRSEHASCQSRALIWLWLSLPFGRLSPLQGQILLCFANRPSALYRNNMSADIKEEYKKKITARVSMTSHDSRLLYLVKLPRRPWDVIYVHETHRGDIVSFSPD